MDKKDFTYLKVGDEPTRMLGGPTGVAILMKVGLIQDGLIYCGSADGAIPATVNIGWKFRVANGAEVDEDLGWDGITYTGSYLVHRDNETTSS